LGGDLTFFKNLPSNSLPTGKPSQSNAQKFPHPGRHIAVNHSQAGCKKDARKTGKLYNFHFSTLLHLQRYYLIKIQSAFNTLCISNKKINRFLKKQLVFSAKAAESTTSEKSSHCSNCPYTDHLHWPKNRLGFSLSLFTSILQRLKTFKSTTTKKTLN